MGCEKEENTCGVEPSLPAEATMHDHGDVHGHDDAMDKWMDGWMDGVRYGAVWSVAWAYTRESLALVCPGRYDMGK